MAHVFFNVNNKDCFEYAKRLDAMKRYDFPLAVRGTLNDLAFKQQKLITKEAKKLFQHNRVPTFFRAFSTTHKATGWDVNSMISLAGIQDKGKKAIKNLQQQEAGGSIKGKSFIYENASRGGSANSAVRPQNYIKNFGIIKGKFTKKFKSAKARFIAAAIVAQKTGKLLITGERRGRFAILVKGLYLHTHNEVSMQSDLMFAFKKSGHRFTVNKHPFIEISTKETVAGINEIFKENAEKRFTKALKK